MALLTNLVEIFEFEEVSGTRTGAKAGLTLTDNNTVTSGTGKVGTAAQFTAANTEYLSIADNVEFSGSDRDFLWCGWVKLDSKTTDRTILYKGSANSAAGLEYKLIYQQSSDRFVLSMSDGTTIHNVTASTFGAPSTATWYFIEAWHDSVGNVIGIRVNRGTANTTAHTTGVQNTAGALWFGRLSGATVYWDGMLDQWGLWNEILSSTDLDSLYNSGNGLAYASFGGGTTHSAAAALTGTGTLSPVAAVTFGGAAALAGVGTLATDAGLTLQSATTLTGTGDLAATGRITYAGSAVLAGNGTLSAAAGLTLSAAAALSGAGVLVPEAAVAYTTAASMTGTCTLNGAATITVVHQAAAVLSGIGTLGASGTVYGAVPTPSSRLYVVPAEARVYHIMTERRVVQA